MNPIDKLLNRITMYRLVVYTLGGLVVLGMALAFAGRLAVSPTALVLSLFLLVGSAYLADRALARLFRQPTNMESALITALILFLIVHPATSVLGAVALVVAGAVSSASKFLLAWNGKHIFNPAAFAAAVLSLTGLQAVTWWVGSSWLWLVSLVLGLAVVRKTRRFPLWISFVVVSMLVQVAILVHSQQPVLVNFKHALLSSPLIFLSTIMLTEPATMPPRRKAQIVFAAVVAGLYATAWKVGPLTIYPEVALLAGNVLAFALSPKFRVRLQLKEIQKISDRIYSYIFTPERRFNFLPGQYMEWTLAGVPYDSRGNRRTFTIASSPTEPEVRIGVKFYEPASMYKAAFEQLEPGDMVYASQLAGNFTLTGNEQKKLALIAGGIGITPFRSMVKYLTDKRIAADVVLLYFVGKPQELAYAQELHDARSVGVKTIPIITNADYQVPGMLTAPMDAALLARLVPDYAERLFYVSGPNAMVDAAKQYLHAIGVRRSRVKTDHFSGY